jgi:hypothetical protein
MKGLLQSNHLLQFLHVLQGPWKDKVPADASVVLEVDVGRIKSGNRPSLADSGESALDSRYIWCTL